MHLLGDQDPSQNPNILAILEARAYGRRTILNLKWNYETEPFPAPGSATMTQELDQLNRVLPIGTAYPLLLKCTNLLISPCRILYPMQSDGIS